MRVAQGEIRGVDVCLIRKTTTTTLRANRVEGTRAIRRTCSLLQNAACILQTSWTIRLGAVSFLARHPRKWKHDHLMLRRALDGVLLRWARTGQSHTSMRGTGRNAVKKSGAV